MKIHFDLFESYRGGNDDEEIMEKAEKYFTENYSSKDEIKNSMIIKFLEDNFLMSLKDQIEMADVIKEYRN